MGTTMGTTSTIAYTELVGIIASDAQVRTRTDSPDGLLYAVVHITMVLDDANHTYVRAQVAYPDHERPAALMQARALQKGLGIRLRVPTGAVQYLVIATASAVAPVATVETWGRFKPPRQQHN